MTQTEDTYKVLLVDDDKMIRYTLSAFFNRTEFKVTAVESPSEGITKLQSVHYDAVISDVMMEPINGFMFRNMIRDIDAELPVIFLTSLVNGRDNSLLTQIMSDGFSYYVPKNSNKDFLVGKLRQVIKFYRTQTTVRSLQREVAQSQELASVVQRSLLPPWVHFEKDYEFSCLYKPLGKISGDLFEWIPLSEHTCLSIFGDISGHGTHSALGMTAVQSFLKQMPSYKDDRAMQPQIISQEINDFIVRHLFNAVYMCGLIIYWDFKNNFIRYHNSGYMDLLAYNVNTGEQIQINKEHKGSVPLGMFQDMSYPKSENVELHFDDDTLFLITSDGLWDISQDEAGEQNLGNDVFNELLSIVIQQLTEDDNTISMPYYLYDSLRQMGFDKQQDDVSLFVIRKPPLQNREKIFVCRISPDNESVDDAVANVHNFIMSNTSSLELATKIELLLEEHLVNIVKHGIDEHHRQNELLVMKVALAKTEIKVTVWDRGTEWDDSHISQADPDEMLTLLNMEKSENGRGLPIIMKIAPIISRQRHSGLNETIFRIPVTIETEN